MAGGIFLIDEGDNLVEMSETAFGAEEDFQVLLATHPSLMAGDQINPEAPRRWLLVTREAGVPGEETGSDRWSLDHLFLDQDAIPTFVEVKRGSDTRIRREVVGQMLDYAANAVAYWPATRFESEFRKYFRVLGRDPDAALANFLGPEMTAEELWHLAAENLKLGRLRLIFVADRIPPELRRIVEFLNDQMGRTEVLAVELRRYTAEGLSTIVPRVLGITEQSRAVKERPGRRGTPWDPASFLSRLEELGSRDVPTSRKILDWAAARNLVVSGGRGTRMAGLNLALGDRSLFSLDEWDGIARFRVYFYLLPEPFDRDPKRGELLGRLNQIPGVELPPETQYQGFPLEVVESEAELQRLFATLDWLLAELVPGLPAR